MTARKAKQAARPVSLIIAQMREPTRDLFAKIQEIYENATLNELIRRHEIGEAVKQLTADERKYGQDALQPVSDALGVGVDYLYRCQKLARTWTQEQIETLRSRVNRFGRRIEFTHLRLIANVPASKTRELLIEEFFDDGLTTRQLEQRVNELIGKSKSGPSTRPRSPSAGLASMRKVAADYGDKCPEWQDAVFEPTEDVTSNGINISYFDELLETKKSHEELKQQVDANIEKLDKCIRFTEEARKEEKKKKRHPETTTPARQIPTRKPTKRKPTASRRRVVA